MRLNTDASDVALSAILNQQVKQVTYETKILNSADHTPNKDVCSCVCTQVLLFKRRKYRPSKCSSFTLSNPTFFSRRPVRWWEFHHQFDHQFDHKTDLQLDHLFDQQFDHKWEFMPGIYTPANSLSRLGDPSKETKLNMIGMVLSKIGTTSKFRMIGFPFLFTIVTIPSAYVSNCYQVKEKLGHLKWIPLRFQKSGLPIKGSLDF